jgi:hypothetical protein
MILPTCDTGPLDDRAVGYDTFSSFDHSDITQQAEKQEEEIDVQERLTEHRRKDLDDNVRESCSKLHSLSLVEF